jgi:hypothetical protein
MQSEFIFRRVVSFDRTADAPPHGLVNVYERYGDRHIGQIHPARGGGYLLRNRDGVNLADFDCGLTPGFVALSREPAARLLRLFVGKQEERLAARTGTTTEGCVNPWHNTADYRGETACPECPTQPGLKFAVHLMEQLGFGDEATIARLREEIYTPEETSNES